MPLITILLVLVAVGVFLWAVNTYGVAFIDAKILKIINIITIIIVVIWLLKVMGVWEYLSKITV